MERGSLGFKLATGFGAMVVVIVIIIIVAFTQVNKVETIGDRIQNLRSPAAQASVQMLNGVNQSLAGLRGYILLGNDQFKTERQEAWSKGINSSLVKMKQLSKSWTNQENVKRLSELSSQLDKFAEYQQEIEDIAQTDDNVPALKILFEEAAPAASMMATNITRLIDMEAKQPATRERKALLGMMADVRGTIGLSLANIRAFLLTGDEKFKQKFETLRAKNDRRFSDLKNNRYLLTLAQKTVFIQLDNARNKFAPLPPKMFKLRGGEDWNLANHWLGTKAVPIANAIKEILTEMVENQQDLAATDQEILASAVDTFKTVLIVLLLVGLALGVVLAITYTRSIVNPMQKITRAADGLAIGDIEQDIYIDRNDEIGKLANSFRDMIDALKAKTETAKEIAKGNLSVEVKVVSKADVLGNAMVEMKNSLQKKAKAAEQIAAGNLDTKVEVASEDDVLGNAMVTMVKNLKKSSEDVKEAMAQVEANLKNAERVVDEVNRVAELLKKGKLNERDAVNDIEGGLKK
jgi:methyl-accepting chemotaxis protein